MQTPSKKGSIKKVKQAAKELFEHESPKSIREHLESMLMSSFYENLPDAPAAERFDLYLRLCRLVKAVNNLVKAPDHEPAH